MTSLRLVHKKKRANIQVREYIDFAYILYGKGLFMQALQVLKMAKNVTRLFQKEYMQVSKYGWVEEPLLKWGTSFQLVEFRKAP